MISKIFTYVSVLVVYLDVVYNLNAMLGLIMSQLKSL